MVSYSSFGMLRRLVAAGLLALVVGASRPRVALVATFAGGGPTWKRHSVDGLVRRFVAEHAPWLDALASTVERAAITHNVSAASRLARARAGWCVRDFTASRSPRTTGPSTRPRATRAGRRVYPLGPLHARADGGRTLAKCSRSRSSSTSACRVDADVMLLARPTRRSAPRRAEKRPAARRAARVGRRRGHAVERDAARAVARDVHAAAARRGQYLPFTNTEQDGSRPPRR